jgi:hypothetical protein
MSKRVRLYLWLEDNCLAFKVTHGRRLKCMGGFGIELNADGTRYLANWFGELPPEACSSIPLFMRHLRSYHSDKHGRRRLGNPLRAATLPINVRVKPDMEERFQRILSKLRPETALEKANNTGVAWLSERLAKYTYDAKRVC